jgi:CRP-like cAMP-binding protein
MGPVLRRDRARDATAGWLVPESLTAMIPLDLLRNLPHFEGVGEESLRAVARLTEHRAYQTGEELFREGQSAETLYILASGEVDILVDRPGHEPVLTDTLRTGDVLSWSAIVEPHQLTATCIARTACEVLAIDGLALRRLCAEDAMLGFRIMHQVARELSRRLRSARRLVETPPLEEA